MNHTNESGSSDVGVRGKRWGGVKGDASAAILAGNDHGSIIYSLWIITSLKR